MQRTTKIAAIIAFLSFLNSDKKVFASCSVEVTPNNVVMGQSSVTHFNVSNGGGDTANWVRIQANNQTAYNIANMQATGWYPNGGGTVANFAGGYLEGGTSSEFDLTFAETGEAASSMNWEALLSYDRGETFESCGNVNIQIVPAPIAPQISGVSLTVGNSSAVLSWNTNLTATGRVNYGTTSEYGANVMTSSSTSHSARVSGLSASTEYHYQIQVTSEGGTTSSTDATFTTSAASVTTTTTTTVTNTVTTTNTQTVNQTVILADTIKPTVVINTKLNKVYKEAPIIEGKVIDTGAVNAGIAKIEYSIDGGKNWSKIDEPNGAKKFEYSFVPELNDDGSYNLIVRAFDNSANFSESTTQKLIIDRLAPIIVGTLWRVGPLILEEAYEIANDTKLNLGISTIGGVDELFVKIDEEKFEFFKNSENGLWEAEMLIKNNLLRDKENEVNVYAKDGGGNKIEKSLGKIFIHGNENQSDIAATNISIFRLDELSDKYKLWNGEVFGQVNPAQDKFAWYLPPGTYYVKRDKSGYQSGVSDIFKIQNTSLIKLKSDLHKRTIWNLLSKSKIEVSRHYPVQINEILKGNLGWIEKTIFKGKEINITVVSNWDPRLPKILQKLGENDLVVIPGASESVVSLLKNRGGYKPIMMGDVDAKILDEIDSNELPVKINVNRQGMYAQNQFN